MRPLVFLTVRSLFNGIKRSLTSGRRLIGLIFFGAYYAWIFRPSTFSGRRGFPEGLSFQLPSLQLIETGAFVIFAGLTVLMSLGVLNYRGGFRPADVDVLFPTPVSPRLVMGFRLVRDSLLTLIVPLVFTLMLYRPAQEGWAAAIKGLPNPSAAPMAIRMVTVGFLLISMAWVALGYAASLRFNRPDEQSEKLRGWFGWTIFGLVAITLAFTALLMRSATTPESIERAISNPLAQTVFFLATAGAKLVIAPLTGSWADYLIGGGGLLLVTAGGVWLALRQVGWMYEQAALHTSQTQESQSLTRKGDMMGVIAAHARSGKLKTRSVRWISNWTPSGARALLWKEAVIQLRMGISTNLLFIGIGGFFGLLPRLVLPDARIEKGGGVMFLLMITLSVFITSASLAQMGFIEMLKKGDLQKPLPFTPSKVMFTEILSKVVPASISAWFGAIVLAIASPVLWQSAVIALFLMPAVALLLSSVFGLITMLFPDVDDPTQRGFRSLMTLLGLVLFCAPSAGLFAGLVFLKVPYILAAVPVALLNVAVAYVAASIAGNLYSSFNPSE